MEKILNTKNSKINKKKLIKIKLWYQLKASYTILIKYLNDN